MAGRRATVRVSNRLVWGIVLAALMGAALLAISNNNVFNGPKNAGLTTRRVITSELNFANIDAFESQIRRDVPLGTSKQRVEVYLSRENIPHGLAQPNSGVGENTFYGTVKNVGTRLGFEASLAIRIHLDQKEKVDKIWFRVDYDAP
jgi:hypothetical protein